MFKEAIVFYAVKILHIFVKDLENGVHIKKGKYTLDVKLTKTS